MFHVAFITYRIFILELLTDDKYNSIIKWQGSDGRFILLDSEKVAEAWGRQKSNNNMKYKSLSRAIRYNYRTGLISKPKNQKYCYKLNWVIDSVMGIRLADLPHCKTKLPKGFFVALSTALQNKGGKARPRSTVAGVPCEASGRAKQHKKIPPMVTFDDILKRIKNIEQKLDAFEFAFNRYVQNKANE